MLDVDAILRPWWDRLRADLGDPELFDAHTHIGDSDPDGARQTPEQLLAALEPVAGARRRVRRCTSRTATRRPTTACSRPPPTRAAGSSPSAASTRAPTR